MTKYLGTYEVDFIIDADSGDLVPTFIKDTNDFYPLDLFAKSPVTKYALSEDTWFDGYMTETNCSSIVCKFLKGNDSAKLYRIY